MKKKILIILGIGICFLTLTVLYNFGVFHCLQRWDEQQFINQNINLLSRYLKKRNIVLTPVKNIGGKELFKFRTGKQLNNKQLLYKFYGDEEKHEFWSFPIGTKNYGLYVVVENGIIIDFQEFYIIDSL